MRSDAALAERFTAGDEAAFDVLYERHRPVVLAVSMGVLGTTQDAEDATQETFSALAVALRTKPPAELRPWLIRVARNASIDTTRRRRHRLLTLDGELPEVAARPAAAGQAELAVVLDGIRELPEGQRMALLMRELGGHSYAEIADLLGTDEEAVKGLIARARVGLRTYREATELECSTARATIASEPDGRRYDRTIRRHLRGCAACRAYRAALRDDAKALRAALPIQAGSVATGGIATGALTAAKGTLIGYGLTQAATTCAASACAVGALGGMVFIAPVHRLGIPPILPATKPAAVQRHAAVARRPAALRPAAAQAPGAVTHATATVTPVIPATVTHHAPAANSGSHTGRGARPTFDRPGHRQPTRMTRIKLPPLHARASAQAPGRTSVAPGHTSAAPGHTSAAPGHTSAAPGHTSAAPGHTSAAPGHAPAQPGHAWATPGHAWAPPASQTQPLASGFSATAATATRHGGNGQGAQHGHGHQSSVASGASQGSSASAGVGHGNGVGHSNGHGHGWGGQGANGSGVGTATPNQSSPPQAGASGQHHGNPVHVLITTTAPVAGAAKGATAPVAATPGSAQGHGKGAAHGGWQAVHGGGGQTHGGVQAHGGVQGSAHGSTASSALNDASHSGSHGNGNAAGSSAHQPPLTHLGGWGH